MIFATFALTQDIQSPERIAATNMGLLLQKIYQWEELFRIDTGLKGVVDKGT